MMANHTVFLKTIIKQVTIICNSIKIDEIMDALSEAKIGGLTISDVDGMGRAMPPLVGKTYSMKQILEVVKDSKIKLKKNLGFLKNV